MADENLTVQPSRSSAAPRPRIQTLSDLIFGLALSIGAITLLSEKPADLKALATSILAFGFSFLILSTIWLRYTRIMSVLPIETGRMVGANMLLLFLVSIEPYLFNLIGGSGQIDTGTITAVYGIDLGSMNLILAFFTHELTIAERQLIPRNLLRRYRLQRDAAIVAAAIFLLTTLPLFYTLVIFGEPVRFLLWAATFAGYPVRSRMEAMEKPD